MYAWHCQSVKGGGSGRHMSMQPNREQLITNHAWTASVYSASKGGLVVCVEVWQQLTPGVHTHHLAKACYRPTHLGPVLSV
jgi:hypothetical protein